MKQQFFVPTLLLVGLCMLGLGMGWKSIVPTQAYWTSEQAEEYATAQADLHAQAHSHDEDQEHETDVATAQKRFIAIFQELQRARQSQRRTGHLFVAAGIALILSGIVVHMTSGRQA